MHYHSYAGGEARHRVIMHVCLRPLSLLSLGAARVRHVEGAPGFLRRGVVLEVCAGRTWLVPARPELHV